MGFWGFGDSRRQSDKWTNPSSGMNDILSQVSEKTSSETKFQPRVQLKDLNQAIELADQVGLKTPSVRNAQTLWKKMVDNGWG